jgi:hypothetical protein
MSESSRPWPIASLVPRGLAVMSCAGLGILVACLAVNSASAILGVAVAAWLAFLVVRKPMATTLVLYGFLLPFDSLLGLSVGGTLTRYVGILLAGAAILTMLRKRASIARPPSPAWWVVAYCCVALVTVFWSVEPELSAARIPTMISLVGLYLLLCICPISSSELRWAVGATIVGGAAAGLLLIVQFAAGGFTLASRYTISIGGSAMTDPNGAAVSLLVPLALSVCLALGYDRRLPMFAFTLSAILCVLGIALTESRTGLLSMVVVLVVIVVGARRAGATRLRRLGLGVVLAVGTLALLTLDGGALILRVQEAVQTGGAGRLTIWTVGLAAARQYWAAGAGLETFSPVYTRFAYEASGAWRGVDRSAHSIYLAALVETGVAGLLSMVFVLWSHFTLMRRMDAPALEWRELAWWRLALVASVVGLAVSGLTLDVFWRKWFWWALTLSVGLAQVGNRHPVHALDV